MRIDGRDASTIGRFAQETGGPFGTAPSDADAFAHAVILAICQAGLAEWEGRRLFRRCRSAIEAGVTVRTVFRHAGKAAAIDRIWRDRADLFAAFQAAEDRRDMLAGLPWIGAVTARRLADRLGIPDDDVEAAPVEAAGRERARPVPGGRNAGSHRRASHDIDEVRHAEAA